MDFKQFVRKRFVRSWNEDTYNNARATLTIAKLSRLSHATLTQVLPYVVVHLYETKFHRIMPPTQESLQEILIALTKHLDVFPGSMCKDVIASRNATAYDDSIYLQESIHVYFCDGYEGKFTSCTTLIGEHFEEFDDLATANRCVLNPRSKYYGMTVEAVLAKWQYARERGTQMHFVFECVECKLPYDDLLDNDEQRNFLKQFYNFKDWARDQGWTIFYCERILYCTRRKIAGSVDRIDVLPDGTYVVSDYKCMEEVSDLSYGRFGTSEFTRNIPDSKLHHYSMQVYIYGFLMEEKFNVRVSKYYVLAFCETGWRKYEPKPELKPVVEKLMESLLKNVEG